MNQEILLHSSVCMVKGSCKGFVDSEDGSAEKEYAWRSMGHELKFPRSYEKFDTVVFLHVNMRKGRKISRNT